MGQVATRLRYVPQRDIGGTTNLALAARPRLLPSRAHPAPLAPGRCHRVHVPGAQRPVRPGRPAARFQPRSSAAETPAPEGGPRPRTQDARWSSPPVPRDPRRAPLWVSRSLPVPGSWPGSPGPTGSPASGGSARRAGAGVSALGSLRSWAGPGPGAAEGLRVWEKSARALRGRNTCPAAAPFNRTPHPASFPGDWGSYGGGGAAGGARPASGSPELPVSTNPRPPPESPEPPESPSRPRVSEFL